MIVKGKGVGSLRIAIASDLQLHLEFGDINLQNQENAEVLILSGDICTAKVFKHKPKDRAMVKEFFKRVSFQFPHVVYVMGNHEHYDYDIAKTYDRLKAELSDLPNIHLLEKETWVHNDITFIGGTLWTDMNKGDSLTMWHCGKAMNDFKIVANSNRMVQHKKNVYHESSRDENGNLVIKTVDHYQSPARWSVEDSMQDHEKMLDYIRIITEDKTKKYVVVGHHAPSFLSVAEWYKSDTLMNGAFYSDLSEFIMDRPQIALWTHGHMHNRSDYMMGDTRVVCNPRGYINYEPSAKEFELKYLEI